MVPNGAAKSKRPATVATLEKAVCRRWLSGAEIPEGARENPAAAQNRNRQALRSGKRICGASTPLGRRAHHCLAQPMSKACQGLGEPQSQGAGVLAPRINPPHAPKTL